MEYSKALTSFRSIAQRNNVRVSQATWNFYLSWLALAVICFIDYCGAKMMGLTFIDQAPNIIAIAVLVSTSMIFYGIFGASSSVGAILHYLALWFSIWPSTCVLAYLLAGAGLPPIDVSLDRFDKSLGFDWLDWYRTVNSNSSLEFVLTKAYASISPQIIFSIIFFSHRNNTSKCSELWWMATIAVVITALVSGLFPAMGTFEYYGVLDGKNGWHLRDLHALRDGTVTSFSMEHLTGIISLPSYHTVLGILLTYIYRNEHRMLWFALPLNLVMLISIPSQGGHYLADMFAGSAVAALSIYIFARSPLVTREQVS